MNTTPSDRPLRIFVVDDHRDIAEGLADVLRLNGHEVDVAYNGEQAVRIFREKDFDIAFMDVMMPGMNGVESFLAIRRTKPDAKVVMMTGYSVEQLLDQVVDKGAYGVLHKPVSMNDVLETLERVKSNGLVLIADANPQFGASIKGVLEKNGFRTTEARTGKQALSRVLNGGVDILLLGQDLPVLSGLEVYMELKKRARVVPTIIVAEQGKPHDVGLDDFYNFATTDILTKPFNTDQLLRALEQFSPKDPFAVDGAPITPQDVAPPLPAAPPPTPIAQPAPPPAPIAQSAPPARPTPTPAADEPPPAAAEPMPAPAKPMPSPAEEPKAAPSETPAPASAETPAEAPETPSIRVAPAKPSEPPRVVPPAHADQPSPMVATTGMTREGRILAVDDDVDMVDGLADVLRTQGYEVMTANTQAQAEELIQNFDAQVALLDIRLGKSNGLDLINSLKESRPNLHCVMITGNADKESAIAALQRGAFNYLTKPLHPEELFAVLDSCLDKFMLDEKLREAFTELQEAKQKAENTNKVIGDFYEEIGGALDSMVKVIQDASTAMLDSADDSDAGKKQAEMAKDIFLNVARIESIVNNAADLAKVKAGTMEMNEDEVDIGELVSMCAKAARETKGEDGPQIHVATPNEPVKIWGDERLLRLVILNLLSNAMDFTPAGGDITLGVRTNDNGDPIVEVGDTGPGMDIVEIQKAIENFSRVASAADGASARGGLGLVLVSHLARLHDGELELDSERDKGTSAKIVLPAKRVIPSQSAA